MNELKTIVTTLTATLIFINAVELISPKNKMKKYINFILGLILISVILNPIVKLVTSGEKSITDGIEKYASVFSGTDRSAKNNDDVDEIFFENNLDNNDARKKSFIKNFNDNCEDLLKKKYPELSFKCETDCSVDFNNINIDIKSIKVGVKDKSIKKVQKIEINKDKDKKAQEKDTKNDEIAAYLSSSLEISKEKIEVYSLE